MVARASDSIRAANRMPRLRTVERLPICGVSSWAKATSNSSLARGLLLSGTRSFMPRCPSVSTHSRSPSRAAIRHTAILPESTVDT
ncbi:hypothetical protein D3C76_1591680 [compost metagenome]